MGAFNKLLIIGIGVLFVAVAARAEEASAPAVGFQAWKTARIEEAKTNLEKIQAEKATATKPEKKPLQRSARPDQRTQQAQSNLEIAKELSLNDYFVLYVSQLKEKQEFVEVAKKLTPDETAELLMAYQRHLSGGPNLDLLPAGGIGSASLGK